MTRYPFKFLDAYTREDRAFFFGRDEEIARLYEIVFQADLILLHGASGTGKTSLIQCGLAGKFESHDWLPLSIRRGQDLNASVDAALRAAGGDDTPDDLDWLHEDLSGNTPVATAAPASPLARRLRAVYLKHFRPIYLIFDQFEELYVLGSPAEQEAFIRTIQEILRVEQPVKVILSIREEYLGHLYEFERAVPELLRKKLRVEPMNLERVKTVLLGVSSQPDSNVQLEAGHEAAIAEGIFKKIRGQDKTLHIPLPYLQVFLDKFYLQVAGDESRRAEATFTRTAIAAMGDLGDVLRNFLDEQATAISQAQGLPEAEVWRALSPFVTLEGTKEPLSEAQLTARLSDLPTGTPARLLQALVQGRILRFSEASQLYEIAHDALAKQIHAKRSDEEIAILEVQRLVKSQTAMKAEAREYFTEKQLGFMEPYLGKLVLGKAEKDWVAQSRVRVQQQKEEVQRRQAAELAATRKRLRVVRGLLAGVAVALVVAVGAFLYAQKQNENAEGAIFSSAVFAMQSKTTTQLYDTLRPFRIYEDSITALIFKGFGIQQIPEQVFRLKHLKLLNLRLNQLTSLPSEIRELKNLEILDLSSNQIRRLPPEIWELKNLTHLYLGSPSFIQGQNELTELPAEISMLKNLVELDLGDNQLVMLPPQLWGLTNLTLLDVSGNHLTFLSSEIEKLKNLENLDLSYNQFNGYIPVEIWTLKGLVELSMNNIGLTDLPAEIQNLENLKILELRRNRISNIVPELWELKKLRMLDLQENNLDIVQPQIANFVSLTELRLGYNKLKSLPSEIRLLTNLITLDLGRNQLVSLPPEIEQLTNLENLNLDQNQFISLPLGVLRLKNLTTLNLSRNQLTTLPIEIGELKSLVALYLNGNEFTNLPREIRQLKSLTTLDLGDNQFTRLPPEIRELKKLTHLYLHGNSFTSLPPEIWHLGNLKELNLIGNQLTSLPAEIENLKNIRYLYLDGNPIPKAEQEKIRQRLPWCEIEF